MASEATPVPAAPAPQDDLFPPLTTTLEAFLGDGSDAALRRLITSLTAIAALMERNRARFAGYIGVSTPPFMMIAQLAEAGEMTVSALAERMGVSSQFITTEAGKLVERGILEKRAHPEDRRSSLLALTAHGRRLVLELAPLRRRINDITFRSLTRDSAEALQAMLDVLLVDVRAAVHALDAPDVRDAMAPSAVARRATAR